MKDRYDAISLAPKLRQATHETPTRCVDLADVSHHAVGGPVARLEDTRHPTHARRHAESFRACAAHRGWPSRTDRFVAWRRSARRLARREQGPGVGTHGDGRAR